MPVLATPCWDTVAQRYGVAPELLYAIARTESNLNPKAVNRAHAQHRQLRHRTDADQQAGTCPSSAGFGIREADLYDPCINLQVGWLMADSFARHGITWNAVGACRCSHELGAHLRVDAGVERPPRKEGSKRELPVKNIDESDRIRLPLVIIVTIVVVRD